MKTVNTELGKIMGVTGVSNCELSKISTWRLKRLQETMVLSDPEKFNSIIRESPPDDFLPRSLVTPPVVPSNVPESKLSEDENVIFRETFPFDDYRWFSCSYPLDQSASKATFTSSLIQNELLIDFVTQNLRCKCGGVFSGSIFPRQTNSSCSFRFICSKCGVHEYFRTQRGSELHDLFIAS